MPNFDRFAIVTAWKRLAVVFPTGGRFSRRRPFFWPATELSFFLAFFGDGGRDAECRPFRHSDRTRGRDRRPFFRPSSGDVGDGGRDGKFRPFLHSNRATELKAAGATELCFFVPLRFSATAAATPNFDRFARVTARPSPRPADVFPTGSRLSDRRPSFVFSLRFSARAAATANFDRFSVVTARPRTRPAVFLPTGGLFSGRRSFSRLVTKLSARAAFPSFVAGGRFSDRRLFFRPATELCFCVSLRFSAGATAMPNVDRSAIVTARPAVAFPTGDRALFS